jgi:hypothetical protein
MNKENKKYEVWVDDNYQAGIDPNSYQKDSEFNSKEDAVRKCEEILFKSLVNHYEDGMEFGDVSASWAMSGDDPFIRSEDCKFSAREFIDSKRNNEDYFKKIKESKNAK